MTPWQCFSKSVQIFLPNLNFSCKESASMMYRFWTSNAQVELLNDINLWRYFGGFLRIARTFQFRKRNSIEKFSIGVTVEVDNQRNCFVMCLDQMAGFATTSFRSRDFPPSFLKTFYDISISLCMNELFVAACC